MYCTHCGASMDDGQTFCTACGSPAKSQSAPVSPAPFTPKDLPPEYRPLSPWSYFWLQVLYAVPVVGFIFLIIFSFKKDNIHRRNFTRSYWCSLILAAIVFAVILIISMVTGAGLYSYLSNY